MTGGKRATATICLVCAASLCGAQTSAPEATVRWHYIEQGSPTVTFALNPANPTTTNVISFVAPTDGKIYLNDCLAAFANGNRASMTAAPTAVTWRRGFNDPLLNGLGAQAATNNPDVRSAKSSLAAASAR